MTKKSAEIELLTNVLPVPLYRQVTIGRCSVDEAHPKNILTNREQAECKSFDSAARRREYISTRWLIYQINKHMDINPAEFALQKDDYGKPFGIYNESEYHISIAHTDHHVLCAISADCPLGIDMEPADRVVPDRLRRRMLHSDEVERLQNIPTIRIWTMKEALVKLQGKGMRTNLNECLIDSINESQITATFNNDKRAKICSFEHDNNWLAIAWNH